MSASISSCLQLCMALVLMAAAPAVAFSKPAFYKNLEGPKFTVQKQIADNVELRRYEPCACLLLITTHCATAFRPP